ncbi:hypothetical protein QN362_04520 [Actimicrobium sp. CCC2.4]|uniref:hypothetical protein n=1 Tax=Actimicrobium sp. CCC2.4 TaxID=3048606 RepID=UPI002AC94C72|nr:hypothetical protein [Actimicrobium sp. CCC2.4]MEB0134591.1 hypothetical protein [Actimicrobium sp. CCC2.4]WPX34033.1 hypothetical protein RHM62_09600 [Actimicrobium sp. CCC2.4]
MPRADRKRVYPFIKNAMSVMPQRVVHHCAALWRRLPRGNGAPHQEVVRSSELGGNVYGIECPKHTAVSVMIGSPTEKKVSPIHANVITFEHGAQAVAGQSPQTFTFTERFLIQGLDSGKGLFQFVGPRTHRLTNPPSEKTILGQLLNRWNNPARTSHPLVLAGRYEVTDLTPVKSDEMHACYLLTAKDRHDNNRLVTVPLTQAAMPFDGNLLRTQQIEDANRLLEDHLRCHPSTTESTRPRIRNDPMILSKAGIGRNAALITYRAVLSQIDSENHSVSLLDALETVVTQERLDRGKQFLHSEAQLEEVHDALSKYFLEHPRGNSARVTPPTLYRHPLSHCLTEEVTARTAYPIRRLNEAIVPQAPISPVIDHRIHILSLLQKHGNANPLELFDALADEHPEVAAFCSVQARRALTAIAGTVSGGYDSLSMHAGVGIEIIDSDQAGVFEEPCIFPKGTNDDGEPTSTLKIQRLLAGDVEAAMALPGTDNGNNRVASTGIFPQGLAVALRTGKRDAPTSVTPSIGLPSAEKISSFFTENADMSTLELVETLAENNPSMAALVHFIDHGLLLRDSAKRTQCERYDYVVGPAAEDPFFEKNTGKNRQTHFPTFLPGVRRALSSRNVKWEIFVNEQWQPTNRISDVCRHVVTQAVKDLQTTSAQANASDLYPIPIYKLLAKAIGIGPVPAYLHQREAEIMNAVQKNKQQGELAATQAKQVRLAGDAKREEDKRIAAAAAAKRYADLGVDNDQQEYLLMDSDPADDVVSRSSETILPLPSPSRYPELLIGFRDNLVQSHDHQAVSSHSLGDARNADHRSWLRSSWLSLFDTLTPKQLADRLRALVKDPRLIENDARLLQAIAEIYHQHPTAFLQGKLIGVTHDATDVVSPQESLTHGAVLGSHLPLNQVLSNHPSATDLRFPSETIESFLKNLQLRVGMMYRTQYPPLKRELGNFVHQEGRASSTLPITLHRAFSVPLLVVEAKAESEVIFGASAQPEDTNRLRMTVPSQSPLGAGLDGLIANDHVDENVMDSLAIEFAQTPVIWCDDNRYSVYLPKKNKLSEASLAETTSDLVLPVKTSGASSSDRGRSWFWGR